MLIPVVLSGGAGTRLWPVSRQAHPKPFIHLPDGGTLLGKTYQRAAALSGVCEIATVTNRDLYFRTKDEYQAAGVHLPASYLLEPEGRNTAPAAALAAWWCQQRHGPEAVILLLSADHLINDAPAFAQAVHHAVALARQGYLVTFGVRPHAPETGFGYIEVGSPLPSHGHAVARFVEKPDAATAAAYLASGRHLWNSGMFCFQAGRLLE
ncbi:MAG: sugar phosphate nucleotidyltransferase, partial [Tepidimonas sp.]|nr:sugar phosphate nucleotidyltransferase [Tepidimonas sp.]